MNWIQIKMLTRDLKHGLIFSYHFVHFKVKNKKLKNKPNQTNKPNQPNKNKNKKNSILHHLAMCTKIFMY